MASFTVDPAGRMDYDKNVMKETLDQMYKAEPVSLVDKFTAGISQGTQIVGVIVPIIILAAICYAGYCFIKNRNRIKKEG